MCGAIFLSLARAGGHPGRAEDRAQSLAELYPKLRTGELDMSLPDGRWAFGLALVRESESAL